MTASLSFTSDLGPAHATPPTTYSDEQLLQDFPGYTNHEAFVNGVRLHYVAGGSGQPFLCLPGWPQTWYSYQPIAAELARHYRVLILDLRGMGSSDKPAAGYDKKTMARDVYELVQQLELGPVALLGHDIGGMVATSFAFNYPDSTAKLVVLDATHPSDGMLHMPLLPAPGTFTAKISGEHPYLWWMAFNQVKELPEQLLTGRFHYLLDWLFAYVMRDETKMSARARAVYAAAYNEAASIRAANAWYQAFDQDMADARTYSLLTLPVLGIGSYVAYENLKRAVPAIAPHGQVVGLLDSGHDMYEEQPQQVLEAILSFLNQA